MEKLLLHIFLGIVLVISSWHLVASYEYQSDIWTEPIDIERSRILAELLFPNVSHRMFDDPDLEADFDRNQLESRKLQGYHEEPDNIDSIKCITCTRMTYCTALNRGFIQEKYYPNVESIAWVGPPGTCAIIEGLARRVQGEIFGNGKTFRDTPLCRDIVMQYLCLFWGSDNRMYTNYCVHKEDATSSDPALHKLAPKPPCRSFCVQIADICANDPDFVNLCYNIKCPPTEDECSPDPIIGGALVASGIGCNMPYAQTPYNAASSEKITHIDCVWLMGFVSLLSLVLAAWNAGA